MRHLQTIDETCEISATSGTALLYRHSELAGTTETLWLHAYPQVRRIIATFPLIALDATSEPVGVIREIPIRRGAEPTDALADVADSYVRAGWTLADTDAYPALIPA